MNYVFNRIFQIAAYITIFGTTNFAATSPEALPGPLEPPEALPSPLEPPGGTPSPQNVA